MGTHEACISTGSKVSKEALNNPPHPKNSSVFLRTKRLNGLILDQRGAF
jgi:hypothetical protein